MEFFSSIFLRGVKKKLIYLLKNENGPSTVQLQGDIETDFGVFFSCFFLITASSNICAQI